MKPCISVWITYQSSKPHFSSGFVQGIELPDILWPRGKLDYKGDCLCESVPASTATVHITQVKPQSQKQKYEKMTKAWPGAGVSYNVIDLLVTFGLVSQGYIYGQLIVGHCIMSLKTGSTVPTAPNGQPLGVWLSGFPLLAHPADRPMSLCHGEASVVRPSSSSVVVRRRPHFSKIASSPSILDRFGFFLAHW